MSNIRTSLGWGTGLIVYGLLLLMRSAEVQMGVGIGEATVLGESQGGFGVSVSDEIEGAPTVVLELSAGIGHVEVRR